MESSYKESGELQRIEDLKTAAELAAKIKE
jgi:hypothetical protein